MPIGTGIVYNVGDLILSQVSSSGTAFLETKIAAATSSLIYFDSTARINSASLNSITVGTASYVSGSRSIITNLTASNISASGYLQSAAAVYQQITSSTFDSASYSNQWVRIAKFDFNIPGTIPFGGFFNEFALKIIANPVSGMQPYSDRFVSPSVALTGSNRGNYANLLISNASYADTPSINVLNAYTYGTALVTKIRSAKDAGNSTWYVDAFITNQSASAVDLMRVEIDSGRGQLQWQLNPSTSSYISSVEFDITIPGVKNANAYVYNFDGNVTSSGNILVGGRVGIGTTSPSEKLHVVGNGLITSGSAVDLRIDASSTGNASLTIDRQTTAAESKILLLDANVSQWGIAAKSNSNNFVIRDADSTERFTILKTNGNIGIGTTNPAYLLDVSGSSRHGYRAADTHQFTGSVSFTDGLFLTNLTASNISASGTGSFGIVGIGTVNPAYKLDVNGNANFTNGFYTNTDASSTSYFVGANGTRPIIFQNNTATSYDFGFKFTDSNTFTIVGGNTLANPTTDLVSFKYDGKVGIGTTNPSALLHIYTGSLGSTAYPLLIDNSSGGAGVNVVGIGFANGGIMKHSITTAIYGNDYMAFNVGQGASYNQERMRIDSNGNVGIGTTTVSTKLAVEGGSIATVNITGSDVKYSFDIRTLVGGAIGFNNTTASNVYGVVTGSAYFGVAQAYPIVFTTNGTERLRIESGGNIGIGTTTSSAKLQVNGNVSGSSFTSSISNAVGFLGTSSFAINASTASYVSPSGNAFVQGGNSFGTTALLGTNDAQPLALETNGTTRMSINSNGNVAINTSTSGFYRLNIADTHRGSLGSASLYIETIQNQNQGLATSANDSGINNLYFVNNFTSSAGIQNQAIFNQLYINGSGSFSGSYRASRNAINISNTASLDSGGNITNTYLTNQISPNIPTFSIPNWIAGTQTYVDLVTGNSTGSINNLYNHQIGSPFPSGGAGGITVTNSYGVYINKQKTTNIVTNGWGIYQADTGDLNIFAGKTRIGSTTVPVNTLDVTGNISASAYTGSSAIITNITASNISASGTSSFGYVGIGTTAPADKLSVISGSTRIASTALAGALYFGSDASNIYLQRDNNYDLSLVQNGDSNSALYLASAGNVYVNIDSNNNDTDKAFIVQNNALKAGTELFRVSETGNVGIGTTSPAAKLHVYNGLSHFEATSNGNAAIVAGLYALQIGPLHDRDSTAGRYYGGIAFNHLLNFGGATTYNGAPQAWIGTRLQDTTGSERDYLVFATKPGTGVSGTGNDIPIERMCIDRDGNVGIGTTSPAYKLDVIGPATSNGVTLRLSDAASLANSRHILLTRGSVSGSIGIAGSQTEDPLWLSRSSGYDLIVASSGNIGIGTSTPSYKLHISGSAQTILGIDSATTTNVAQFQAKANGDGVLISGIFGTASVGNNYGVAAASQAYVGTTTLNTGYPSSLVIGNISSIPIVFSTNNTERMRIDGSGNVGIGTTSPATKFHVYGTGAGFEFGVNSPNCYIETIDRASVGKDLNTGYYTRGTGSFTWNNGAYTERMRIDGGGNVGIGTTTINYRLEVYNSGAENVAKFRGTNDSTIIIGGSDTGGSGEQYITYQNITTATNAWMVGMDDGEDFRFAYGAAGEITDGNTLVKIDQNGNVGIGTTVPVAKLQVAGNISGSSFTSSISNAVGFLGTSSWAQNVVSASFATTAQTANALNPANSYTITNLTASNISASLTGSFGIVGIGTNSPGAKLHIQSGSILVKGATTPGLNLEPSGVVGNADISFNGTSFILVSNSNSADLRLSTNSTPRLTILANGNVGIGTTNPSSRLHISGSSSTAITITDDALYTNSITNDNSVMTYTVDTGNAAAGSAAHIFKRYTTELVRIDPSGNVGIGTSTVPTKLAVEGGSVSAVNITGSDVRYSFDIRTLVGGAIGFNNAAASNVYGAVTGSAYFGVAQSYPIVFTTAGTERMRIEAGGNVGIGTTSPNAKFDVRPDSSWVGSEAVIIDTDGGNNPRIKLYRPDGASTTSSYAIHLRNDSGNLNILNTGVNSTLGSETVTSKFYITTVGNVGVGTTNPVAKLQVAGNVSGSSFTSSISNAVGFLGTSSWAQNVVSASFATTAQTANALNASNTYTIAGLTSAYVDVNGSATIPSTGIYRPSSKTLGLSADATLILKINGSVSPYVTSIETGNFLVQSGNVGIGIANPVQKLHIDGVVGNPATTGTTQNGIFRLSNTTDNAVFDFGMRAGGNGAWIQSTDETSLAVNYSLLLNPNGGNVGIGTTNATDKLTLYGELASYKTGADTIQTQVYLANAGNTRAFNLQLNSGGTGLDLWSYNSANAWLRHTTFNYDGNVGIGTAVPAAKLEITGSSNSALLNIKSPISGAILYVSGSGAVGIGTSAVGAFTLQVSGSFGATTKSFIIDHPTKEGKKLMYGSLESPYHGIRLTGRDTIKDGKCKVELPDYMYKLILHDSINIQLTGIKCNKTLYVDEINIPENYFTIAYDKGVFESYKDYDFFWDFTAIRADVPELNTEL